MAVRQRSLRNGNESNASRVEVLLVQGDHETAQAFKLFLEYLNCSVRICETTDRAVRAACARLPRLVIVDSDCDRLTVIRRLMEVPAIQRAFFVAMGSLADDSERQKCSLLGYQLALAKPPSLAAFKDLIAAMRANEASPAATWTILAPLD